MLYIGLLHALFFLTTPAESATADRTAHTRDLGGQKRHTPRGGVVVWECTSFCVRQMPASTWCVAPPDHAQIMRDVAAAEKSTSSRARWSRFPSAPQMRSFS